MKIKADLGSWNLSQGRFKTLELIRENAIHLSCPFGGNTRGTP